MRGSYSGNTLAFQANADSSILLPRSIKPGLHFDVMKSGLLANHRRYGALDLPQGLFRAT